MHAFRVGRFERLLLAFISVDVCAELHSCTLAFGSVKNCISHSKFFLILFVYFSDMFSRDKQTKFPLFLPFKFGKANLKNALNRLRFISVFAKVRTGL